MRTGNDNQVAVLKSIRISSAFFLCLLASCDHGLSPDLSTPASVPGIAGKLHVKSLWPPSDSLFDLRVVAFRNNPPKSILEEFLKGTLEFSDEIPFRFNDTTYRMQRESISGVYAYVVVAHQYGPDPFQHWRVVGVYTTTGDVRFPSPVNVLPRTVVEEVDIDIDFYNLPPQPF